MQTLQHITHLVSSWPTRSRKIARAMIERYGLPHEATDSRLIWRYNGSWKQTVVHRDGMQHKFPKPHKDILEQTIDYRVPYEKYAEVMDFGGSVVVDRTRGEMVANCDSEERNIVMLNQAHEIAIGRKTPEEARASVKDHSAVLRLGWSNPDLSQLGFSQTRDADLEDGTADPGSKRTGVYHR